MSVQIPVLAAELCVIVLETFFYGVFLVLFITSMYLAIARHNKGTRNSGQGGQSSASPPIHRTPVFITSVALALTITAHWILAVDRVFLAFIFDDGGSDPVAFFTRLSDTTQVTKIGLLNATLLIGDAFIVYRLWVIWGKNRLVVIPPLCTLLGLLVTGVGTTYHFTLPIPNNDIFLSVLGRWITTKCIFILLTNAYCTALIAWRIRVMNREMRAILGYSSLTSTLAIFVESAATITTFTLFYLITYEARSSLHTLLLNIWCPIAGVGFMLINVRVGLGWAQKGHADSAPAKGMRFKSSGESSSASYPASHIAIDVRRSTGTQGEKLGKYDPEATRSEVSSMA